MAKKRKESFVPNKKVEAERQKIAKKFVKLEEVVKSNKRDENTAGKT